jgi:hypothetical protein
MLAGEIIPVTLLLWLFHMLGAGCLNNFTSFQLFSIPSMARVAEMGRKSFSAEWWGVTFRKMLCFSFAKALLLPWIKRSIIEMIKRHRGGRGY